MASITEGETIKDSMEIFSIGNAKLETKSLNICRGITNNDLNPFKPEKINLLTVNKNRLDNEMRKQFTQEN